MVVATSSETYPAGVDKPCPLNPGGRGKARDLAWGILATLKVQAEQDK